MDLSKIAGVTTLVMDAATYAIRVASAKSFRFVWVANAAIGVCTTIRTSDSTLLPITLADFASFNDSHFIPTIRRAPYD